MTRILFFPDDHSLIWLDSPLRAEKLVESVNCGEWQPPAPYAALPTGRPLLRALHLDQLVVVLPSQPLPEPVRLEKAAQPGKPSLSPRQHQVLQLLAEGLSTKEIARRLNISPRTVHFHIANLKGRFGSSTRAESVSQGARQGLV